MISLVIPTFNGAKFLRQQLDSIYRQTILPDEVIVVDDCSTDATISILEEYKDRYGLKIYKNENNLGYNKNFQKGIKLASGDYICLCDQDDVWMDNKIEVSLHKLQEIEGDLPACVSSNCYVVDGELNKLSDKPLFSSQDSEFEEALCYYSFQGCSLMFNKKLKDLLFPFPDFCNYDIYIGIYSIFVGNRYSIGTPLMYYRQHGHNAIGTSIDKNRTAHKMGDSLYSLISDQSREELLQFISEKRYVLDSKKELLQNYVTLFSYNKLSDVLSHVNSFPYYNSKSKTYAMMYVIRNFIKKFLLRTINKLFQ